MADYGFGRTLDTSWTDAIERITAALKEEGFGVLTRIDVHDVLKAKIGAEIDPYVILGACNPKLASQAVAAEDEVGLLLPCNVLVRALPDGRSAVSIADPAVMGELTDNPAMGPLMADAKQRLAQALEAA